jgi:guanylate kinase
MTAFLSPSCCLFVLSGPCGSGKTSLALALLEADPDLGYTRSVTTKQARDAAKSEEHYDYVSRAEFMEMVARGEFVQWIHPSYDEYYGTRRAPIEDAIQAGRDMVFDYCPEGYLNLRRFYPEHVVGIFLMAPDLETLRRRLFSRGTETAEELELRYQMALQDFNFVDQHDYHVVNDDFDQTLATIRAILRAEKARVARHREAVEAYRGHARGSLLRYYDPPEPRTKEEPTTAAPLVSEAGLAAAERP